MTRMFNPPHPGFNLRETLEYLGIAPNVFAECIGVPASIVHRILDEKAPITPDIAVRLAKAIPGPSVGLWLRMQAAYDSWQAEHSPDVSQIVSVEDPTSLPKKSFRLDP